MEAICYWNKRKWIVYGAVVMPDHVHVLAQPLEKSVAGSYDLSEILYSIKSFSAHKINQLRGRKGIVWQEESYDRIVRNDEEFAEKLEYIRTNPFRRNLVENPEVYRWLYLKG